MTTSKSNILALAAAAILIVGGLVWLQSRPEDDECSRWQRAVRHEAVLIASQRDAPAKSFLTDAARAFAESQPSNCQVPTEVGGA